MLGETSWAPGFAPPEPVLMVVHLSQCPSQVAGATPPIFAETLNRWIFLALLTRPGKR